MNHDWTRFDRKIRIRTSCDRVYSAWAIPSEIIKWFLATCQYSSGKSENKAAEPGDVQLWTWHNYPNPQEVAIFKTVPGEYLEFSFVDPMRVSVRIMEEEGYCLVHLIQFGIPDDDVSRMNYHVGCRQAWSTWLLNLKSWLEHGILLHDKELGERPDLFDFVNT